MLKARIKNLESYLQYIKKIQKNFASPFMTYFMVCGIRKRSKD